MATCSRRADAFDASKRYCERSTVTADINRTTLTTTDPPSTTLTTILTKTTTITNTSTVCRQQNLRQSDWKWHLRSSRSLLFALIVSAALSIVNAQVSHHQYFKITPQSDVNVIEGSTLTLQCVVGNQRGPVQWAKDGFVLGYDRGIPGYPRYSMVGDATMGVHNLRIIDITADDNGEFQCQVGPGGKNYAPIRATSKVNVLVAPTSIEITAPQASDAIKNASHVVQLREGAQVTIECAVTGGSPPSQIRWFRKNVEIRPGDNESHKTESTTLTSVIDSNSILESEQVVFTSKSSIRISGHSTENGVPYTCEAVHPALTTRPMRKTVTVSVLYPPGEPEVYGYDEDRVLKAGDKLKLDCKARGGNPLAQLLWYRNDEKLDHSYTTVGGKYSINSLEFVVDAHDNNAVYRCEASSPVMEKRNAQRQVKLAVHFAPAKLTIDSVKEARAGDVIPVTCRTEPSNPAANISWVVDGRSFASSNSTVQAVAGGGFITTSNISISITNQDRNMKMLSCYAFNDPPESIHITGYDESKALQHESTQRLTCICTGGNPLCQPRWYKADREISEGVQHSSNGNTATSDLVFQVDASDNGAVYKCTGENAASPSESIKASVTLTVHFPPNKVSIKLTPKQPVAGTELDILCQTASSNPQSVVTWWRDGLMLVGHQDGVIDALYGGRSTRNILRLNVTSADDGSVITCQAKNQVLQQSVHDAITLNIQYPPEFVHPPLTQFDIIEGESSSFNQSARANPSVIDYKWKREDDTEIAQVGQRVFSDGALLNVTKAQRSDAGIYKLYASNELGQSETSIKINVQYPPSIVKSTDILHVEEGQNANLECWIDANPVNERIVNWIPHRNLTKSRESLEEDESFYRRVRTEVELLTSSESQSSSSGHSSGAKLKSTLLLMNASIHDSGTSFDCVVNNGVGLETRSTVTLLVLHKPAIDRSPINSKSASESGSSAKLICRAQGTPNVTFTWKREGVLLGGDDSGSGSKKLDSARYTVEATEQIDVISYQSVLVVHDVKSSDYGSYDCVARNTLGFDAVSIQLNRTSKPDVPRMLRIGNITSGSVSLKWIPGFDGGIAQSFRVRYRSVKDVDSNPAYHYRDVFPANVSTTTITGLRENIEYVFHVMAHNSKGDSEFTSDLVKATTLKESAITETEKIISKVLAETGGDVPRLIVVVTLVGSALLLFNIVLVVCFVRKKRNQRKFEEESDGYSGGTESKGSASSKATMELYETQTNGTKPSTVSLNQMKGINETSLSGGDDCTMSNKSDDQFSGPTEYEMFQEIPPATMMTLDNQHLTAGGLIQAGLHHYHHHHHGHHPNMAGMSTYFVEDPTTVDRHYQDQVSHMPPPPPMSYTNSVAHYGTLGSELGVHASFYNAIATEDDYISALQGHRGGGGGTLLTTASPMGNLNSGSNSVQLEINPESAAIAMNAQYGQTGGGIHQAYLVTSGDMTSILTSQANQSQGPNGMVAPLPPLRSLIPANGSLTTFLPAITEEPTMTPIGHLV